MLDAYVFWRLRGWASLEEKIQNNLKSKAGGGGQRWSPPRDSLKSDSEEGGENEGGREALHSDCFSFICQVEEEFHLLAVCMGSLNWFYEDED